MSGTFGMLSAVMGHRIDETVNGEVAKTDRAVRRTRLFPPDREIDSGKHKSRAN
jgi:hypothetical protein